MSSTPPPADDLPPTGGYGAARSAPTYNLGDAISYGWAKFQANAGQIVIAGVVLVLGVAVLEGIGILIRNVLVSDPSCTTRSDGTFTCDSGSGFVVSLLASAIMGLLFFLVAQIIGAGIIRGALGITDGRPFVFSEVFRSDKLGPVVITSLLSTAIIFVGMLLCYLPGLVAAFFLQYALFFVIDRDLAPVDALRASFELVKDNLGNVFLWWLVGGIIAVVGFAVCLVGAIVTVPLVIIGTAYTYKKLTDQPVAA